MPYDIAPSLINLSRNLYIGEKRTLINLSAKRLYRGYINFSVYSCGACPCNIR